jgi:hypothetical protein
MEEIVHRVNEAKALSGAARLQFTIHYSLLAISPKMGD